MSKTSQERADALLASWKKAFPSQINDCFHQVINGTQERILAFSLPSQLIINLTEIEGSELQLYYGCDSNDTELAFKILIRSIVDSKPSEFHLLEPLSYTTANENLSGSIRNSLLGSPETGNSNTSKPLDLDIANITSNLISPVSARFMFHNWQCCPGSTLSDQVNTFLNGRQVRLTANTFDAQVSQILRTIHKENSEETTTLVLLGLHQVMQGTQYIYHFGPILQTYLPADINEVSPKGAQASEPPIQTLSFELSRPCPPSCIPPN